MTHVQPASPGDISSIVEFQCNMARETEDLKLDPAIVKSGVEAVFNDPNKGRYYVAKEKDETIGCLLTTPEWSEWRNGTVLWIQSVYVSAAHRGRGVYRALYSYIQDQVREDEHLRGVRLYVDKRNQIAQKVYASLGMDNQHYELFEWMKN